MMWRICNFKLDHWDKLTHLFCVNNILFLNGGIVISVRFMKHNLAVVFLIGHVLTHKSTHHPLHKISGKSFCQILYGSPCSAKGAKM